MTSVDVGMRGTSSAQDSRFKDKEAAFIKATKFPKSFNEKVDLRKINLSVLRSWIAQKVTELIKIEDDVVVEYVFGMLEDKEKPVADPRKMQNSLIGFMDKHSAAAFMEALWTLLLSAQKTIGGVPAEFIAAKKAELEQRQTDERKMQGTMIPRSQGREQAGNNFDRRRDEKPEMGLPPRPGGDRAPFRRPSPPPERERDSGYRRGPPPRRFDDRDMQRDQGYPPRGGYGRQRSRSRSPGRGSGYRRRSPSPAHRRRSPSPAYRRRSPSPRRRRSPSPVRRGRERSMTPPLRSKRPVIPDKDARVRQDTPPTRRRSPSPPAKSLTPPSRRKAQPRGRSRSRTPTASDRSVTRSRSPTVTPPHRHASRNDSPPPRRRRSRSYSRSPPTKRRRASPPPSPPRRGRESEDEEGVVKKGRGRFVVEEVEAVKPTKKLEGPLSKSKWAD